MISFKESSFLIIMNFSLKILDYNFFRITIKFISIFLELTVIK